jgi:hypothetical protein
VRPQEIRMYFFMYRISRHNSSNSKGGVTFWGTETEFLVS